MDIPHFIYLLISCWTLGISPLSLFGSYKQWGYEYPGTSFCMNIVFQFSWVFHLGVEFLGHMVNYRFNLWRKYQVFCSGSFTLPPGIYEGSSFSIYRPSLAFLGFLVCLFTNDLSLLVCKFQASWGQVCFIYCWILGTKNNGWRTVDFQ